ncbi:TetR/AcrR family transcriptional regulator [Clostridium sp. YIM B02515]|uniref:TetR/AcrR family transcriptional regulator n=1 Tax=Clostridium rhizosphaerae TaxID=2803861 RepID=A0ABS1TGX2_9CLOT|nr:TetR/AcrR family transcriptional regulator [Clostridium rhizosphaerae]MBL4938628.1 TetR/AcrR family transcriptional regulator [Clostridium rhizosphaerae]
MPKIIKDVEQTIRNFATQLFMELSYTNVDMKMISQKSKVAVGTLYNYYENKKQLYISILKESWQNTFNKLDNINELTISSEQKLEKLIKTLYEDIESRNGLGKALINTSIDELKDDSEINDLKLCLISKLEYFFECSAKVNHLSNCSNVDIRLAESLMVCLLTMIEFHPNDKEDNINFLIKFISLSLK